MFAVIDVETTGLRPGGPDRIVEVAVVRLDDDRNVVDEWTTLVDPGRAVRGTRVHGISTRHVEGAPTFADIAGDLADRLADAVPVAHNARFDFAFIEAEYRRLGYDVPYRWLCTLELAARLEFSVSRSLRACCANLGIPYDHGHAALVDAEAAARLLAAAYEREVTVPVPPPLSRAALPAIAPTGRLMLRPTIDERPPPPLRRLVPRLPAATVPPDADPAAVLAYAELLDEALEDRTVSADEALALCQLAGLWGLNMDDLAQIHRSYMTSLVEVAMADGVLTRAEHEDLRLFADLLGVDRQVVLDDVEAALGEPATRQDLPHQAPAVGGP